MSLCKLLLGKYLLFVVLYNLLNCCPCTGQTSICCFPKQFESNMYAWNTESPDKDESSFALANGTMKTAYDSKNKRTYFFAKYTSRRSDDPGLLDLNSTFFIDYKSHVFYRVLSDVFCQQGLIESDLFIECIPKNATLIGEGYLGDTSTVVQTYLMTLDLLFGTYQFVASVIHTDKTQGECMPVQYSLTDHPLNENHNVIVSDIYDVTRGIKDTSVFTPPPACGIPFL